MNYTIWRLGSGWYSFADIPQGYIKIDGLMCGSDKEALKRAKKINPSNEYTIQDRGAEAQAITD